MHFERDPFPLVKRENNPFTDASKLARKVGGAVYCRKLFINTSFVLLDDCSSFQVLNLLCRSAEFPLINIYIFGDFITHTNYLTFSIGQAFYEVY